VSELTVIQRNEILTVVKSENDLILQSPGPQGPRGPQGPAGTPGGSAFEYTASSPSLSWVLDHDLGRKVHVSVFDDDGNLVFADVEHGSVNQTTITFSVPTTGSAVIS
jgi:hypothetical protein